MFFIEVMALADQKGLLSKEHFPVDGTLIQAWASVVSLHQGHALMENRCGLVVGAVVTHAHGYGERQVGVQMMNTIPSACPIDVPQCRRIGR